MESAFRWVGYPTPAPILVSSAAPETIKGCWWKSKRNDNPPNPCNKTSDYVIPHLGVNVSANSLWHPGRLVELGPPLLLRVSCHICHQLAEKKWDSEHKEWQANEARKPASSVLYKRWIYRAGTWTWSCSSCILYLTFFKRNNLFFFYFHSF